MLYSLASSLQAWHQSEYGKSLRFCDATTLQKVRAIWKYYAAEGLSVQEQKKQATHFFSQLDRARRRKQQWGTGAVMTASRSAAPIGFSALEDCPSLHDHYWRHGVTETDQSSISKASCPNPMFGFPDHETLELHYGTDPLLGFHLAAAYAPLEADSRNHLGDQVSSRLPAPVRTARLQFRAWAHSFKRHQSMHLTLRFFSGDAVTFCHSLRGIGNRYDQGSCTYYRDNWGFARIDFENSDYFSSCKAPTSFDVIDTSNLIDHIGAPNVLTATIPLLAFKRQATIYTEILVGSEKDPSSRIDKLFNGNIATISLLLGLFPCTYWTNASVITSVDEAVLNSVVQSTDGDKKRRLGQFRSRLCWKVLDTWSYNHGGNSSSGPIRFDEMELARLLFQMYLSMFAEEDVKFLYASIKAGSQWGDLNTNHRGTFAILLSYFKQRLSVDWTKTVQLFLNLVEQDDSLMIGRNSIQELYLHLHLNGVCSIPVLEEKAWKSNSVKALKRLATWNHIPPVLCVTLEVPRDKMRVFTDLDPTTFATPFMICSLSSAPLMSATGWENMFAALQVGFGRIQSRAPSSSGDICFDVVDDPLAWKGTSPLVVSFLVPSWVILQQPQTTQVNLCLQQTPSTLARFKDILGFPLSIFKTTLDSDFVHFSAARPNNATFAPFEFKNCSRISAVPATGLESSILVKLSPMSRLLSLTSRNNAVTEKAKKLLGDASDIKQVSTSPLHIRVNFGKTAKPYDITFPLPIQTSRCQPRIARKSGWFELVAPIVDSVDSRVANFLFPPFIADEKAEDVVNWNLHRLNLDDLPILNTKHIKKMQWLVTHSSFMFSPRERRSRDNGGNDGISRYAGSQSTEDVRTSFKDGLFSLFMQSSGLQGHQANVFGLHKPGDGGIHVVLFVRAIMLDSSNATVVLDVGVLALTHQLIQQPSFSRFLGNLSQQQMASIKVSNAELRLWKQVLPAFAERCRDWKHNPHKCELIKNLTTYQTGGLEDGRSPFCRCGIGHFPKNYTSNVEIPDVNTILSKYAVRAAIPLCFPVPYVEECFDDSLLQRGDIEGVRLGQSRSRPAPKDSTKASCAKCGNTKAQPGVSAQGNLMSCGRCHVVHYCSRQCQKADWRRHKAICE